MPRWGWRPAEIAGTKTRRVGEAPNLAASAYVSIAASAVKAAASPASIFRADRLRTRTKLVAEALGVPNCQQQIRELLHHGSPLSADLLEAISAGLDVPIQALRRFAGHGTRGHYVEGLCGGGPYWAGVTGKPDTRGPCSARPPVRARVTRSEPGEPSICPITCPHGVGRAGSRGRRGGTRLSRFNCSEP